MNAYHGGAKRIELNSALALGGLTPTIASGNVTAWTCNGSIPAKYLPSSCRG